MFDFIKTTLIGILFIVIIVSLMATAGYLLYTYPIAIATPIGISFSLFIFYETGSEIKSYFNEKL